VRAAEIPEIHLAVGGLLVRHPACDVIDLVFDGFIAAVAEGVSGDFDPFAGRLEIA
jgi:hypothetical protein